MNENGCSKCFCFAGYHLTDAQAHTLSNQALRCEAVKEEKSSRIEIDFGTEINTSWPLIEFIKHPKKFADHNELNEYDDLGSDLDSYLNGSLTDWSYSFDKGGRFRRLESTRRNGYLEIISEDFFDDRTFYWTLDQKFLGNRLNCYDHTLKLKLLYSILRGDVSEKTFKYFKHWPDLILASRIADRTIAIGYKGFDYDGRLESDRPVWIEATLNERNWFQLDPVNWQLTDQPINAALFRLALMRVELFLLRAKYHTDQIESRLYRVQLGKPGWPSEASQAQLSNHTISRRVVNENCASFCPPPFAGSHCEQCEKGYYMAVHFRNKLARKLKSEFLLECKACDCNGQPCDERGKCLCAGSTRGERCERCSIGHFGDPLRSIQCKPCAGQKSFYCSPCTDGYHLPAELNYGLVISNSNLSDSPDPSISNQLKAYREKCAPCGCSKRGSLNQTCDQFTGQCHCKDHHSGSKCNQCDEGFKLILAGCLAKNCWQNEVRPHNVCISKLIDSMNEFDFESKFRLADLNATRFRPLTTLGVLEARHRDLNNTYSQFWSNNFVKSLKDSNTIFESLNEDWKSKKRELDALIKKLSVSGRIAEIGLNSSEQAFERLIVFRDEITQQIDKLVSLKYQRLFDREEIPKFYNNEAIIFKRIKKEINEDYYMKRMKESTKFENDLNRLYQNVSNFAKQITLKKEEIIEQFDRLFRFEGKLVEQRDYIENELETQIDLVNKLLKNLNHLLATVEQLTRQAEDDSVQIEQTIVDAHYINNVTSSIASKLALGFFDFEAKMNRFVQTLNDDLRENSLRLNAENEVKYTHICDMHLMDLKQEVTVLEKSLNNSRLLSEDRRSDFVLNHTNLISQVQLDVNQINNLDLYLNSLDLKNHSVLQNLSSDLKRTKEPLENKASHLAQLINEISVNLNDIANSLETKKFQIETLNNNTFIIDEMGGNVKIRNDLLMEIEQGLNNLTRKIYLTKYMDNSYFISPAIEIKIFEHDLTLSYLSKELLPDYLKRLSALRQDRDPETLNSTVDEQLYHINSSIQIKKKCVDSFELRNKKIELLNEQTKQIKTKVDSQVQHAKQLLSSLNLGLAMQQDGSGKCERTISLDNLEPGSHFEIEFFYSFSGEGNEPANQSDDNRSTNEESYAIFLIGSIDKQFISFELEQGKIKVSWNFGSSFDYLKSPLKLSKNDKNFKQNDAYYQVQFVCIAQKASLTVRSALDSKEAKSVVAKYTGDLMVKLNKRLYLGKFADNRSHVSSDDRQSMNGATHEFTERFLAAIADLNVNGEPIGLWNFENTNDFCAPSRAAPLNEHTDEVHTFNGRASYLKLGQINRYDGRRYTIRMDFRTYSNDGLLLATFNEASHDLIAIEIKNGHLRFTISTDRLQVVVETKNNYNDGTWRTVMAEREDHLAMITTNEEQLEGYLERKQLANDSSDDSPNRLESLELDLRESPIFIGGLPIDQRAGSLNFHPFHGCVRQIQIETTLINLNNQNSFGFHGSAAASPNLIKQMSFKSDNSSIRFSNLPLRNWTNLGFSFRTMLSNCSILSVAEIGPDQTVGGKMLFLPNYYNRRICQSLLSVFVPV